MAAGVFRFVSLHVKAGCEAEFEHLVETKISPERRGFPGLIAVQQMRRSGSDGTLEYAVASVWRSGTALDRYRTCGASLLPELDDMVDSQTVVEYELVSSDEFDVMLTIDQSTE